MQRQLIIDSPLVEQVEHIEQIQQNDIWTPQALGLGPGAVKGLLEIGFLYSLDNANLLRDVEKLSGCSVGSLIILLILCRYSLEEITKFAIELDFFPKLFTLDLRNAYQKAGLVSHDGLRKELTNLITGLGMRGVEGKGFGIIPTLSQLYHWTGKTFYIAAYNLSKRRSVLYSHITHPELSSIEAVIRSCNIPGVFQRLVDESGDTIIDGAFGDPYPIRILDDGKTRVLGIYIQTGNYLPINNLDNHYSSLESNNSQFYDLMNRIGKVNKESKDENRTESVDLSNNANNDNDQQKRQIFLEKMRIFGGTLTVLLAVLLKNLER